MLLGALILISQTRQKRLELLDHAAVETYTVTQISKEMLLDQKTELLVILYFILNGYSIKLSLSAGCVSKYLIHEKFYGI